MIPTRVGKYNIIVIYQYGKVGSSSIGVNISSWLHTRFPGTTMKPLVRYPKVVHIHDPKILDDILKKYNHVLIINATRNFYHRQISEFFQQSKNREKIKTMTMEQLSQELLDNKIYRLNDWYERFESQLGFSLNPFDYTDHYSWTKNRQNLSRSIDVLIVRLEDSKHWENIFKKFLHPKIKFSQRTNLSKNCWYGDVYTKFKSHFIYPQDATDLLAQSDTHIRFYKDLGDLNLNLPIPVNKTNESSESEI